MRSSITMQRNLLFCSALGLILGFACVCFLGCGDNTKPEDVKKKQSACDHEWSDAASGEVRCKKCGLYK